MKELPKSSRRATTTQASDRRRGSVYPLRRSRAGVRLIGVEYLVSDAIYQKMPAEEKAYWHDHKFEVDAGLLKSLTQVGDEAKKSLAGVRPLWGKVYHTRASGKTYLIGPASTLLERDGRGGRSSSRSLRRNRRGNDSMKEASPRFINGQFT